MMKHLKLWASTTSSVAADKTRSMTARAGEASTTLRRIVSDSDLAKVAVAQRGKVRCSLRFGCCFEAEGNTIILLFKLVCARVVALWPLYK